MVEVQLNKNEGCSKCRTVFDFGLNNDRMVTFVPCEECKKRIDKAMELFDTTCEGWCY